MTQVCAGHSRRIYRQLEHPGKGNIGKEGEKYVVSVDMDGDF